MKKYKSENIEDYINKFCKVYKVGFYAFDKFGKVLAFYEPPLIKSEDEESEDENEDAWKSLSDYVKPVDTNTNTV